MNELHTSAINRAKELLKNKPFDVYHTFDHHQEVVKNSNEIVKAENLTLKTELLEVAAWWHDVFKNNQKEEKLLTQEFSNIGISKIEIKVILEIISGHSFGREQQSVEAKLLYDADKIALVSIPRWEYSFRLFDQGKISKEERDKYIPEWNRRMPILKDKLNFVYSKHLFRQRHTEFVNWLTIIGRYQDHLMI